MKKVAAWRLIYCKKCYICGMEMVKKGKKVCSSGIFGFIEGERRVSKVRVEDVCRDCGIDVARYYRLVRGDVRLMWEEAEVLLGYYGYRINLVKEVEI